MLGMWVISGSRVGSGDIFQALYPTALLDVIREVSPGTELHYEVYVPLCTLVGWSALASSWLDFVCTHYDIKQPGDMSVGETLQDLNLSLQVVKQLRAEATSIHCLNRYLVVRLL